ncbi:ABC transporter substrate-binding protein [Paenibacillus turpanensis]|uniref:ABC transporter substrate-binding protein n=1 Tax=Paenibacillus turpanensis TaxID=2689078 RepID=UPI00140C2856|nr:ABC transporter substrate-binding protein [Paenibacillus turpanensis]
MLRKLPLIPAALLLIMTVLAAACGNPSTDNHSHEPNNSPKSAETKTVKDALNRDVTVPVEPERIIAINNFGELAALGVKPIGTVDYYLKNHDPAVTQGIESIGDQEPNMEKVTALSPDLIIISDYLKPEVVESLQKIAPTFATKFGLPAFEQLHVVAELLGKTKEEQAFRVQYDERLKETKQKLQAHLKPGETALVVQFYNKAIYTFPINAFPTIYEALGYTEPDKAKALTAPASLSEEVLPEYAADTIFVLVADQAAEERFKEVASGPVWKNLSAVKNNKLYVLENVRWSELSAYNMNWQLTDIVTKLGSK